MLAKILTLLAATVILVPLCKRLKLGSVVGYLVAGILLGPFGVALIEGGEALHHVTELGIALLLFLIGLELEPQRLWALRRSIGVVGGAQIALTTLLLTPCLVLGAFPGVRLPLTVAILAAAALAMSSTAFVLQQLGERGELVKRHGRAAFGVLLAQDLAVIPLLAILPVMAGDAEGGFSFPGLVRGSLALAAVVLCGKHLVRPLFRWVSTTKNPEVFTALTLLLSLGTALLLEQVGLSLSLGAFLAGVLLATSEYRHELHSNIEPFQSLLMGLFFVSVGVDMNLRLFLRDPGVILAGAAVLVAVKAVALWALGPLARLRGEDRLRTTMSLAQGGEFA
jgi:glutathione-regulated potassium-efflux system ancillary protein KefC/glutathione-regulated potassium-efflux system protein KefB